MRNELKDLVNEVKYKGKKTLEDIAGEIGYSRAYLNNEVNKGTNKKLLEVVRTKYANIIEHNVSRETPAGPHNTAYTVSTKDHIDALNKHNDLLAGIIQSNLTTLLTIQQVTLAEIKAALRWRARLMANGNAKKEEQYLQDVNMLAAEYLAKIAGVDIKAQAHK